MHSPAIRARRGGLRIVIPITGSRGDVQPFIALGMGLRAVGHEVCLATHADFAELTRSRGLEFFPIEDGARALHETETGQRMFNAGKNPFIFIREFVRLREPLLQSLVHACHEACQDADVLVVPTTAVLLGVTAAEKLGIPVVLATLQPTLPTRFRVSCLLPPSPSWLPLRNLYNLLSHYVVAECFWQLQREAVNQARQEVLGLPPLPFWGLSPRFFQQTPSLHGYSPLVVPKPADWSAKHRLTGYWFLETGKAWQPPANLLRFLEAGPSPVCVGFGSMPNPNLQEATDLVVRALARAGQRGILLTGWGGLEKVHNQADIFSLESAPHDWLFPYTAAVVHHGGAGTTAAALRAGVPSIVVPFMADQPFWGRRVFELGAGPKPIPRRELTVDRLADAIRGAVVEQGMRTRAAALSRELLAEDGVSRAVEAFQEWHGYSKWNGRHFGSPHTVPGMSRRGQILEPN
jgi:UDP:flavonoid glycosyltransferase YjiC (YdhE family)